MITSEEQLQQYAEQQMRPSLTAQVRQDFTVEPSPAPLSETPFGVPIVINNFNRLEYLSRCVDSLRTRGYDNLYIIDNNSTYEPLLDYYKSEGLRVFYLTENVGYLALWRTSIHTGFIGDYYVYTDPDIEPVEECPADFVSHLYAIMQEYEGAAKVGLGLRIDDLPRRYARRDEVFQHEIQFYSKPVAPDLYFAPIDTTMALYRPGVAGGWWLPSIRTGGSYMARHLSWYADTDNPSEEEIYYRKTSEQSTHWTGLEASDMRGAAEGSCGAGGSCGAR